MKSRLRIYYNRSAAPIKPHTLAAPLIATSDVIYNSKTPDTSEMKVYKAILLFKLANQNITATQSINNMLEKSSYYCRSRWICMLSC